MPKIKPFEKYAEEYENWFERKRDLYKAELKAVQELMPPFDKGLEIGAGTGRFAAPLNIKFGVEPSPKMAGKAKQRGINVFQGTAENLPFSDDEFDLVLMVTTICFVDDISQSLSEAHRVLKENGYVILGFIDKDSELGQKYQNKRKRSRFYREAVFVPTAEILNLLQKAGFKTDQTRQVLIPGEPPDAVRAGFGEGSFVVIRSTKT